MSHGIRILLVGKDYGDLSSSVVLNWLVTEVEEGVDKENSVWDSAWELFEKPHDKLLPDQPHSTKVRIPQN
jgi:hypothetical protein